jgi:hypothetical protein
VARISLVSPGQGDITERELARWATALGGAILAAGFSGELRTLTGPVIEPESMVEALANSDVTFFFGHGVADRLGRPSHLIDAATIRHAATPVIVALACDSGRGLGPRAVASGVRAYLGFSDLLVVPIGDVQFRSRLVVPLTQFALGTTDIGTLGDDLIRMFQATEEYYRVGPGRSTALLC